MNQNTILVLAAIIVTVGIVITASSITTPPSALALKPVREKDTRSNPNSAERTSSQESDSGHHQPPG